MRITDERGEQLGVITIDDALRRAEEAGLDFIEVAATADPPVCRIDDLGKFRFEQDKRPGCQEQSACLRSQRFEARGGERLHWRVTLQSASKQDGSRGGQRWPGIWSNARTRCSQLHTARGAVFSLLLALIRMVIVSSTVYALDAHY